MRFGLYLLHGGFINADQLVAALEKQHEDLPQLGQLAIEGGLLSVRELFSVLRTQSDLPKDRFGDTAVELGFLTRKEVNELLINQSNRKHPIGHILVEQGVLSAEQCESFLEDFRQEMEKGGCERTRGQREVARRTIPLSSGKTQPV